ncbi:hypothetical protein [Parasphingorhabdus sp.]|uniref:hypothetical protein n=1 Tax=Parasphingorhabdus sp. TaxID=2709688 RepID=UPI002B26B714|nr:hypothetical protein [Parasphingorhabdus sp.]|tara:strand:- start:3139 stop:3336 length:198 start_codon:yes stop_codon:yes gene_type:complete
MSEVDQSQVQPDRLRFWKPELSLTEFSLRQYLTVLTVMIQLTAVATEMLANIAKARLTAPRFCRH